MSDLQDDGTHRLQQLVVQIIMDAVHSGPNAAGPANSRLPISLFRLGRLAHIAGFDNLQEAFDAATAQVRQGPNATVHRDASAAIH